MLHAKFQDHRSSGSGGEDFLKVFTIYGHVGHLGNVTWTIYINFLSHCPCRLHMKFGIEFGQVVSEKKMFENNGYINVYSPGQGQTTPWGQFFLTVLFSQYYSPLLQVSLH